MYVPPFDVLLSALGLMPSDIDEGKSVTIPSSLFKLLLERALASGEFDEQQYLQKNPDIKEGVQRRQVVSAAWHYTRFGYFEKRRGGTPLVDEAWYRRTYPDVAHAIRAGRIRSASEHFEIAGAKEWRAPSEGRISEVREWKAATGVSG